MATVEKRISQVMNVYGPRLHGCHGNIQELEEVLRLAVRFGIQLGAVDGVIECADRMGAAFRDNAELPAILQPQAG